MNKEIIFFIPNIDDGGIEKNLILLSNYFIKQKHNVTIIYSRISKKIYSKLNAKISLKKTVNFFNLNFLNVRINNTLNCFLFCLIKIKFEKKSVLISMQDHPLAIILSITKNVKSIIRIANHPVGSLKFFNNYLIFKFKLLIKIFFYQFASIIICNSKESACFFRKKFWIRKKIYTIYNPIKIKKINKFFNRNKYKLLNIGRLENQKNLFGLINAFYLLLKINNKYRLTIVGKGSEKKKLINFSNNLKILKFINFKNYSNPDNYLKKQGIFILNSFFEGLPNILIEAMQYKIPIISTDCKSGPREILNNGRFGYLVKVNDPYGLAEKINQVTLEYKKALKKSNNGFKSLNRFDLKQQCQKYNQIIKKL